MSLINIIEVDNEKYPFFLPQGIDIKLLSANAKIPTRGSEEAAGYDLYAAIDEPVSIPPHARAKIGTGLSFSYHMEVLEQSLQEVD